MAGAFVWHELMTTNTTAATAFYAAVIADPQGAIVCLFRGLSDASPPTMTPGRVSWNELMADDVPTVWPFDAAVARTTASGGQVINRPVAKVAA